MRWGVKPRVYCCPHDDAPYSTRTSTYTEVRAKPWAQTSWMLTGAADEPVVYT